MNAMKKLMKDRLKDRWSLVRKWTKKWLKGWWPPKNWTLTKRVGVLVFVIASIATFVGGYLEYGLASERLLHANVSAGDKVVQGLLVATERIFLDPKKDRRKRDLKRLLKNTMRTDPDSMSQASAYDSEGTFIVSAHEAEIKRLKPEDLLKIEEREIIMDQRDVIIIRSPVTVRECETPDLDTGECLKYKDPTPIGYLIFVFNKAPVMKVVGQLLLQSTLVNTGEILVILLLLWFFLPRILKIIEVFGERARAIAEGDFDQKIEGNFSDRTPIGRTVMAFNEMSRVITQSFRFINKSLMRRIREGADLLQSKMHNISIINGDMKGFTSHSQDQLPPQIVRTLNRFFTLMGELIVNKFNGTIDKFMGDGILGYFGDDVREASTKKDYVRDAVRSAIYSQVVLSILAHAMEKYQESKLLFFRLAIVTGKALLGSMGAINIMMDYSLTGLLVNLSDRFQKVATPGGVAIDKFTLLDVGKNFLRVRSGDEKKLKGIVDEAGNRIPIQIFHILWFFDQQEIEAMQKYLLEEFFTDQVIYEILLDVEGEPTDKDQKHFEELKAYIHKTIMEMTELPMEIKEEDLDVEDFLEAYNKLHSTELTTNNEVMEHQRKLAA